jgi:hypothetical protein
VNLRGAAPPVWRRLEVPSAITLDHLHQALQEAFGWSSTGPAHCSRHGAVAEDCCQPYGPRCRRRRFGVQANPGRGRPTAQQLVSVDSLGEA